LNNEVTDEEILTKLKKSIRNVITIYAPRGIVESEVLPITTALVDIIPFDDLSQVSLSDQFKKLGTAEEIGNLTDKIITDAFTGRKDQVGKDNWQQIIRYSYLSAIDHLWVDHLDAVDDLRSGIGLRGYGQRDPLVEYKAEAFAMFERLVAQIETEFSKRLFRIQIGQQEQLRIPQVIEIKPDVSAVAIAEAEGPAPAKGGKVSPDFMAALQTLQKKGASNDHKNLGRNDPCWCGSGKKYKKCHYPN
jgi:preprotein translocase subunit SecA